MAIIYKMNIFSKTFQSLKNKLFSKQWKKNAKYPIVYAFTYLGKDYYEFKDSFNIPYQRALIAVNYQEEYNMRMTREMLKEFIGAIEETLNANPIQITKIMELIQCMKDRLDWSFDTELIFKLASVLYFTDNENPAFYDVIYNSQKIKEWKQSNYLEFFFLLQSQSFLSSLQLLPIHILTYSKEALRRTILHYQKMLEVYSLKESENDTKKALQLKIVELELMMSKI